MEHLKLATFSGLIDLTLADRPVERLALMSWQATWARVEQAIPGKGVEGQG